MVRPRSSWWFDSINSGKAPLIVVDGFPGGDIRALNQDDIKSIDAERCFRWCDLWYNAASW